MSWDNLVYLVMGLGIGSGISWVLGRKFPRSSRQQQHQRPQGTKVDEGRIVKEAAVTQDSQPDTVAVPPQAAVSQEGDRDVSNLTPEVSSKDSELDTDALKEELKQTQLAYQMASEMSKFKAGFLARSSHELRSPLSSLIGLHQLILNDLCEDPSEEREFVAQANTSAIKLMNLIDEIISVAKTEHGTTKLDAQPLNLAGVLEEVYNLTHLQATNRSLRLHLSPPEADIYVQADQRRLRQVLVNMVDAAISKMQEGSIKISAQNAPISGYFNICIDAECPPDVWIEPVDLLQLPLENNEQPRKQAAFSTGMNLLMNQMLIEVMRGRLEVVEVPPEEGSGASTPASFTRMQCSVPLAPSETA